MREKIFSEILKMYPSCHDLLSKRILTDKILNLPVDGVQVTEECTNCKDKDFLLLRLFCPYCNNTGKIMRTLTIGEALEMLPKMVKELYAIDNADGGFSIGIHKALTAKDGGIVEVFDDSKD